MLWPAQVLGQPSELRQCVALSCVRTPGRCNRVSTTSQKDGTGEAALNGRRSRTNSPEMDLGHGDRNVPLRTFPQRIGADTTARYVGFDCADGYYSSIDMASALHPQTILTFKISDEVLAPKFGYPLKLRIPTKVGFKNPKWIVAMYVTNRFPGGFWEDRGYNWFGGV
jgi:hypothetical protein